MLSCACGQPYIQFLYRQHLATKHKLHWLQSGAQFGRTPGAGKQAGGKCYSWPHAILRPAEDPPDMAIEWGNLTSQHGVYRPHVPLGRAPPAHSLHELLARAVPPSGKESFASMLAQADED